jgi:hypothetical protein
VTARSSRAAHVAGAARPRAGSRTRRSPGLRRTTTAARRRSADRCSCRRAARRRRVPWQAPGSRGRGRGTSVELVGQHRPDPDRRDGPRGELADPGGASGRVPSYPPGDGDLSLGHRRQLGTARSGVLRGHPATVDEYGGPAARDERSHDVDARAAVAGLVLQHHRVLVVPGAVHGHASPLVLLRRRLPRGKEVVDRDGRGLEIGGDDVIAVLAVVEPVELPLTERPRPPRQKHDRDGEEHPAAAQQESHAATVVRGPLSRLVG